MESKLQKEKLLYTVKDLAQMLDIGENAIRNHLFRKTGLLPEPISVSCRKIFWSYEQLIAHFRSLTPPPVTQQNIEKKIGRPKKRESLLKNNQQDGFKHNENE